MQVWPKNISIDLIQFSSVYLYEYTLIDALIGGS